MALSRPPGGQRLSHLRSIGSWAPVPGVSPVIHFSKAVTLFGRNIRVVDYHLNLPAAATTDLNYISRIHARIIRTNGEYILVDSSLTGVYVNDIRIKDRVNLREGDTVTFGHPAGKNLLLGSHTRQPNSPFYFLFEHCDCCPGQMQSVYADRRNFPQLLKGPDLVSAGVSPPGNLALAGNVFPQMALPGVLPGRAPLANSVTQHGPQDALAPPPNPALSASSPLTAQKASEQSSFPSSPCLPLSALCRRASQILRSASPDYTLPDENSFAATESPPPPQESPESGNSVSHSGSESTVECDTPPPQELPPHEAGRSDPEGGCVHPLLPSPTCSEVSEAADSDGSPKAAEASGPWEETLQLTPVFPTETEGESGCAQSVSGPESPALSEADEEQAQMDLCPSMEETACLGKSFASEPESPVEEMEEAELARSRAQVRRGSVEEREENLMEKHPAEAPFSSAEAEMAEAEGVESGAVGLSAESQVSELGHIQQHDSAKRMAEIHLPPGEEPTNDSSTKILSRETLDSERRNPLLPSRHLSSDGVDLTVASPQKAAASEDVEMEPPTGEGLEGLDGHLGGRELEPAMSSAIPADAEGVCDKASMVDLCAETGRRTDRVKPGEMEVAATESFKALDASQVPGAEGADSKAREAREMLLQKQPETLVLGEQFKGRFCQREKPKDWRGASDTADENLHSKDLLETREGAGRALGTDLLQARPFLRGNKVLAGALETSVPEPPENLGEVISEQCLFQSSRILFEDQRGGQGSVMEGKWEPETPRSAESSNNLSEVAADSRLQDVDKASKSHDSSLGMTGVPVVGLSGGEPPSYRSGSERQLKGDSKDPPREEESEWRRSTISTLAAAAANEDAANQHREAQDGLDKDPTCLVGQEEAEGSSAADASLVRCPSPEQSFWGSAGRKGDSSRGGLEEGRIPHLGDCSLAGTQLPSSNSQHEAEERSVSDSSHLLSCQYVTKDERFTSLNEEGRAKTTMGEEEEGEASLVANAPLAVTKRDFDPSPMQVGSLNGPCSAFSSSVINQRLVKVDLQELKPDIVEPERLETCLEVASQGADVGETLLCLEDPLIRDRASEEPEAPVERISLPVPGEPGQDVLLPEESSCSAQIAKAPHCMKAGGSPVLPLPSIGFLQPGDVAVNLPVEPTDDSDGALQLPDGDDGLCGQIPAPEAETGEPGQLGPSKTDDLHGRRDASWFDPAEQTANATESREAFRELTEESATRRPADLAIPETRTGPPKGTEMSLEMSLEGQTSSRCDQGSPGRAASPTAGTEAEEPSFSGKSQKRASEAPVEAGGEEMEPDPANLAGQPEKNPLDSTSKPAEDGRVAWKGFPEVASQDLVQGSWPVAGRLPGQPGTATVASPLGEAVKGPPASEASSSPQSGKGGYAQTAGMVPEDANRLPAPENACRLGKDPEASAGHRGGLGCSEPCEALLQEEEKPNRSAPRKRSQNGDLDLKGSACRPKKLCWEKFASLRCPGSDPAASPVAPPPHRKEGVEQLGKAIENFLNQCRNQVPLCSDPTERNGEALAQIVRNYFKSNIYSNALERGEAEEALSSETAAAKGIDCQSEGGAGGPRESPGSDGPGSPKGEEAEGAYISEDAPVSPGCRSAASSSSTKEESKGSGAPRQEGFCYFEEEPFPMEVGSAREDSGSSSPAESPNAELAEGPWEEEWDTPSSLDITASSQSYELSPSPHWSNSDQALDSCSEGSGSLSETDWYWPSDTYYSDEHPERLLDVAMPWPEDSPAVPRDLRSESAHPLSPLEQEAPGHRLQRGEPDGGDGPGGSACREDPGSPPEKAAEANRRGMPAQGSGFPQGSPGGSPGPGHMESAPREPSPSPSLGGSSSKTFLQPSLGRWDPPLKTEPSDGEPGDQDCGRKEPPPPSGRAPVASALGGDSPGEGPSCPPPGPAPAEGSAWLLVKEEPVQEDKLLPPPMGAASSPLSALRPSQAGERGSPGKDLCRPELRGVGQAAPHQASQEAPWIPGTSGCFPGDQGACGALPWQGDVTPLARSPLADPGLHSQRFQEAKKQPWPPLSYPASSSPLSPSVCRHSHVPKTSADEQPEGPWPPADFGGQEPGAPCHLEEAGLGEPSDAECLHVAAAFSCPALPEVKERAPLPRDPPAQTESHSRCLRSLAKWASSEQDVAFQLQECQSVLAEILQALTSVEGLDHDHVEKWRDQIAALQKATKMPQTHIAVVGNTGAGKSCLLNALLDEEAMLPTSAMRACTAVVVEISRAAEGSPYEAEVEFLSREEWEKELAALLEDMKDKAGILRKRCPDRKTEAGAAYSRVKAVYGRVDELDKLEDNLGVTQHLGTVKHISAETAADFRMEIEKFIDSRTDNLREMKGGEFWPIVKCVRIRVATAEVLRTGAVLVDLPGTRDSNAARDTTAREVGALLPLLWGRQLLHRQSASVLGRGCGAFRSLGSLARVTQQAVLDLPPRWSPKFSLLSKTVAK
uniref:FHA domain-containing protein n=1 Tax=Laticauda laticaudata TaxID=8630 RepID=A0A8C5SGV3_LATLA